MTFEEAWAAVKATDPSAPPETLSIRGSDEERRYVWACAREIAPLGPAIEIGSANGGTSALMTLAGAKVISVDDWRCGQRERTKMRWRDLGITVEMRVGKSDTLADTFTDRSVGLVLVDADHWGEAPFLDYKLYAPKIAVGGYLLVSAFANGHPDVTVGVVRWLANEPEAQHFRFVCDFRRESAGYHQTTMVVFRRTDG